MNEIESIAFYLPQFHPINVNDKKWGKGFTEWTNVAQAKPLYKGHIQPLLPSDLGFYDLRVPEVRIEQARLAEEAGIKAFCYWHYWFGNGRRVLERPFNEVLESGQPDFPFCLAWANGSWTGKWKGLGKQILIEQTYPGVEDYEQHFISLIPAFSDNRYYKVRGKNLFVIYGTHDLPDSSLFIETWRTLALKNNLPDFYFVGVKDAPLTNMEIYDGWIKNQPTIIGSLSHPGLFEKAIYKFTTLDLMKLIRYGTVRGPRIYPYKLYVKYSYNLPLSDKEYPNVLPNWDNTPRIAGNGMVLHGSTPDLYGVLLEKAITLVEKKENKLIFIKAWNEWAEGNMLEPSIQFGDQYLGITKSVLLKYNNIESE